MASRSAEPGDGVAVLAVGVRPERLRAGDPDVVGLAVARPADADELVEAFRGMHERGHGIALFPEWLGDGALARVESARSAAGTSRVAIFPTSLPPLAAGVLAGVAAALDDRMPAGALLAALRRLEARLRVFAWLGSVAGLPDPRPRPLQRLGSRLPGPGYVVSSWPEPVVRRARRRWDGPSLDDDAELIVAGAEGAERLLAPLAGLLDGLPRRAAEPTPLGPSWWGTERLVEAVAYPRALEAIAGSLEAEINLEPCRWCGEPVASTPCPFCGSAPGG